MKNIFKEKTLLVIIILSILLRIIFGLITLNEIPKTYGWYQIAKNVIAGEKTLLNATYSIDNGNEVIVAHYYLVRSPLYVLVYVLFIVLFKESVFLYLIIHSIFSMSSIYLAFQIFKQFLSKKVALIGAAFVAFYPYFVTRVWNATEDNLYIMFILLSIFFIFKYFNSGINKYLIFSGIIFGLSYLVRNTILFFIILLIPIIFIYSKKKKFVRTSIFTMSFIITIIPWLFYGYSIYGKIVVADYSGSKFWAANNKYICLLYPKTSIDRIESKMWNDLSHDDFIFLIGKGQLERDRFLLEKAKLFIRHNLFLFIKCGMKKTFSALSLTYNPTSSGKNMTLRNSVHIIIYIPLLILGFIGIIFYWKKYKIQSLIFVAFFFSLLIMSFISWSHTRHTIPYHLTYIFGVLVLFEQQKDNRFFICLKKLF